MNTGVVRGDIVIVQRMPAMGLEGNEETKKPSLRREGLSSERLSIANCLTDTRVQMQCEVRPNPPLRRMGAG